MGQLWNPKEHQEVLRDATKVCRHPSPHAFMFVEGASLPSGISLIFS